MTDHPDTDLTDHHGEAEALRRENADLRRINQNLRQIERNVQAERERQFRRAEAAEAALAAIRAPDPVTNAGSCQAVGGEWLIHKAGRGWYRPNAQGYTSNPTEAGRYTHADALSYSHPNGWGGPRDGITIKRVSEVFPAAQVAEAYEVAANRLETTDAFLFTLGDCARFIRKHTPDHASAALAARDAAMRNEGRRQAAEICNQCYGDGLGAAHKAILAALEPEDGE